MAAEIASSAATYHLGGIYSFINQTEIIIHKNRDQTTLLKFINNVSFGLFCVCIEYCKRGEELWFNFQH